MSTLIDSSIPDPGPTINISYFPDTVGSTYSDYWTSNTDVETPNSAWVVHFSDGSVKENSKMNALRIRAVRGEQDVNSFTDNGDGTISDTSTGLMWEVKTDDGGPRDKDNVYTWKQALSYCEDLVLAEHDDWRLPNRYELQSMIDYNRYGPALDPIFSSVWPS